MSYSPPAILPEGQEIERQRKAGATFEVIGARYGVSRQAVYKRHKKWKDSPDRPQSAEQEIEEAWGA